MATITTAGLAHHYGSLERYRHWLARVIFTPGVHYIADEGMAMWLVDAIASYMSDALSGKHGEDFKWMSFWKLKKTGDTSAILTGDDGNENVKVKQEIEYTDIEFEGDELQIWAQFDGEVVTLMIPSEY